MWAAVRGVALSRTCHDTAVSLPVEVAAAAQEPPSDHGHWNVVLLGAGLARARLILDALVGTPGIVVYCADESRARLAAVRTRLGDGPHLIGRVSMTDEMALRRVLGAADALVDVSNGRHAALAIDACLLERVAYIDVTGVGEVTDELLQRAQVIVVRDMVAIAAVPLSDPAAVVAATIAAMARVWPNGSQVLGGLTSWSALPVEASD